jgi:hypothetical protein
MIIYTEIVELKSTEKIIPSFFDGIIFKNQR